MSKKYKFDNKALEKENEFHTVTTKIYEKGMSDAWNIAKRIILPRSDGGFSAWELNKIFGSADLGNILKQLTAAEAAEKIKTWEEEKLIHVGDIVKTPDNNHGIVTHISLNEKQDGYEADILCSDGHSVKLDINRLSKSGHTADVSWLLKQIEGDRNVQ